MGRDRRRREGKPTKGRRDSSGPQIYRKAYRVDLSRSLSEHRGWSSQEPPGAGLRGRWAAAVGRPLGQLSVSELILVLTQGVDATSLHLVWPVIHARLEEDITAAEGSSLLELMLGRHEFWTSHPHAQQQLVGLIGRCEEQLAGSLDTTMATRARQFAERHRA